MSRMLTATTRDTGWHQTRHRRHDVASSRPSRPWSGMDQHLQSVPGEVIDLVGISQRAGKVVAIYDEIASGISRTPGALDDALKDLNATQLPPGRLGNDIALLASGAQGASRQHALDAIERLRRFSTVKPAQPTSRRWRPRARQRRDRRRVDTRQLQLPGFELPESPKEAS